MKNQEVSVKVVLKIAMTNVNIVMDIKMPIKKFSLITQKHLKKKHLLLPRRKKHMLLESMLYRRELQKLGYSKGSIRDLNNYPYYLLIFSNKHCTRLDLQNFNFNRKILIEHIITEMRKGKVRTLLITVRVNSCYI